MQVEYSVIVLAYALQVLIVNHLHIELFCRFVLSVTGGIPLYACVNGPTLLGCTTYQWTLQCLVPHPI